MSDQQTIVQSLVSDHDAIIELLDDPAAAQSSDRGGRIREQLVMNLVRHFVAEQEYLYPTARKYVAGGDELADADFARDRGIEQSLKDFEDSDLSADELATMITGLRERLTLHISEQQTRIFAPLETACDSSLLAELGEQVRGAEMVGPTRPRLRAPSTPAAAKASSLVAGFIDNLRDSFTKRGTSLEDSGD